MHPETNLYFSQLISAVTRSPKNIKAYQETLWDIAPNIFIFLYYIDYFKRVDAYE